MFSDGGLLTGGAALGNIMLLVNAYFLWQHRQEYSAAVGHAQRSFRARVHALIHALVRRQTGLG